MKKSRIPWIDICRGVGILFVIYGHILGKDSFRYILYAFHMPLFFFLSGLVFNPIRYKNFWGFFKKTTHGILIPYFLFAISTYVFWFLTHPNQNNIISNIPRQIYGILYGSGTNGNLAFNEPLWFLPCLFLTKILFGLIVKLTKNPKKIGTILLILSLLGYSISQLFPILRLPFGLEVALTAIVFYGMGFLWSQKKQLHALITHYGIHLFLFGLTASIIFATLNFYLAGDQVDMRINRLNNYFFFYSAAFSGIITWVSFSILLRKNVLLQYLGKHSMVLFAWHYPVFEYLNILAHVLLAKNSLKRITFFVPSMYTVLLVSIILALRSYIAKVTPVYEYAKYSYILSPLLPSCIGILMQLH